MTFLVPFDGSELAESALVRATEFGDVLDEDVLAVSVIPKNNTDYARRHDWVGPNEAFDREAILTKLHKQVTDLAPTADYRHEFVDRFAPPGTISSKLRQIARDENASMVFIGSENAGHLVTSMSSVGAGVATDVAYDIVIIRHRTPSKIKKVRNSATSRRLKSDFYLP